MPTTRNKHFDKKVEKREQIVKIFEDLDSINTSNLYKYYKSMIEKDLMDIFVVGNIDFLLLWT